MTHLQNEHRPPHAEPLADARLRLVQAMTAVRSAASVAPAKADDLARCHALLADARDLLERLPEVKRA